MEGLDQADGLIHGTTDWQVVDGDLAEDTLGVNDEQSTERNTLFLDEDTIISGDLLVAIGNEGKLEIRAEASLLAGLCCPGQMRVDGISGDS